MTTRAASHSRRIRAGLCRAMCAAYLAVGEHHVLAAAVFDVPVGIEHIPVGGALDGGVCHQLILEEARLQELHQGHGVVMT
jgi:hypothetical protein